VLLGIACILIGLGATVFYARRLVKPVHALTDVTRKVASGDLSARANIQSGDEIETLAISFNSMTDTL
jgi:methyl-accepting chemotaxis protein